MPLWKRLLGLLHFENLLWPGLLKILWLLTYNVHRCQNCRTLVTTQQSTWHLGSMAILIWFGTHRILRYFVSLLAVLVMVTRKHVSLFRTIQFKSWEYIWFRCPTCCCEREMLSLTRMLRFAFLPGGQGLRKFGTDGVMHSFNMEQQSSPVVNCLLSSSWYNMINLIKSLWIHN